MLSKVLIANRGEIALRVVRTCRDLGVRSVAVYSDQDRDTPFVRLADEAYSLDGTDFASTYMNPSKILDIAQKSGAQAIHPGYGFLSENAEFVRMCDAAGVKFIGPSGDAIDALGDKVKARKVAESANVAPVPGLSDFIEGAEIVRNFISQHGFPVILKRADGGGGHGITVVRTDPELENFLRAHSHDLGQYFIERFVENARHVETQCGRDSLGNFTVFSTRDCSLQRRNQKLVEEAPAPYIDGAQEEKLYNWSKKLFETVEFVGLGTCEYLLETKQNGAQDIYFLEVNPRLQVEHTVSEEVTGLDLVEQQLLIASGETMSVTGNLIQSAVGHSFELRITSENPHDEMQPTGGTISKLVWPQGQGVRIESGVELGDLVTTDFDSMVAKVVVTANTRELAIARVKRALVEFELQGIATPKALFEVIFSEPDFISSTSDGFKVSTKWLENKILPQFSAQADENANDSLPTQGAEQKEVPAMKEFVVEVDGRRVALKLPDALLNSVTSPGGGSPLHATSRQVAPRSSFLRRSQSGAAESSFDDSDPSNVISPIQGIVVSVVVQVGQQVDEGDLVCVLEAMKMEKFVTAKSTGIVEEICVESSDSVNIGQTLVKLQLEGGS
ncbi:MAG: ATP-grasp domain-containing protein [Candidatus Ancillula sp.]|jgi:acetyl-CoA/propionyl-CoA carboxylase biotin carboxyl carrier protein|nr:ATP-grasp domain-containing protein [Candidatus Ancillula sp.]